MDAIEKNVVMTKSFLETGVTPPRYIELVRLKEYGIKEIVVVTNDDEFDFKLDEVKRMNATSDTLVFIMKDGFSEESKIFEFFNANIVVLKYLK